MTWPRGIAVVFSPCGRDGALKVVEWDAFDLTGEGGRASNLTSTPFILSSNLSNFFTTLSPFTLKNMTCY